MAKKRLGKAHREGISIMELADIFPDKTVANAWFESVIWPNGRQCPRGGSMDNLVALERSGLPYYCWGRQKIYSISAGTTLQHSKVALCKRVFAIHLEMKSLMGVSSTKLHRATSRSRERQHGPCAITPSKRGRALVPPIPALTRSMKPKWLASA